MFSGKSNLKWNQENVGAHTVQSGAFINQAVQGRMSAILVERLTMVMMKTLNHDVSGSNTSNRSEFDKESEISTDTLCEMNSSGFETACFNHDG